MRLNFLNVLKNRGAHYDALRFLLAGGFNTLLTLALYQAFLGWLPPQASYLAAWIIGLIYVAVVYPNKVFVGGDTSTRARLLVAGNYLLVYGVGAFSLHATTWIGLGARIGIFISLAITTILGFLSARFILRRKDHDKRPDNFSQ